eukprot:3558590-Prymnesium_polylepis.1
MQLAGANRARGGVCVRAGRRARRTVKEVPVYETPPTVRRVLSGSSDGRNVWLVDSGKPESDERGAAFPLFGIEPTTNCSSVWTEVLPLPSSSLAAKSDVAAASDTCSPSARSTVLNSSSPIEPSPCGNHERNSVMMRVLFSTSAACIASSVCEPPSPIVRTITALSGSAWISESACSRVGEPPVRERWCCAPSFGMGVRRLRRIFSYEMPSCSPASLEKTAAASGVDARTPISGSARLNAACVIGAPLLPPSFLYRSMTRMSP